MPFLKSPPLRPLTGNRTKQTDCLWDCHLTPAYCSCQEQTTIYGIVRLLCGVHRCVDPVFHKQWWTERDVSPSGHPGTARRNTTMLDDGPLAFAGWPVVFPAVHDDVDILKN